MATGLGGYPVTCDLDRSLPRNGLEAACLNMPGHAGFLEVGIPQFFTSRHLSVVY